MTIDPKYKELLLEALSDKRYRLALELDKLKGGPMDKQRKMLTKKQALLEALEHEIERGM
jgi:hypothetical protein